MTGASRPRRRPRAGDRDRPHGAARVAVVGASLIAVALLVAACGGASSAGAPNTSSTTTRSSSSSSSIGPAADAGSGPTVIPLGGGTGPRALKFSVCMRANGVSNYPDPDAGGDLPLIPSIEVRSPRFLAADQKCAKYTALGAPAPSLQQTAQGLRVSVAFAACMRAHAIHDFPDPEVIDGVATTRLRTDLHPDLNPNLPLFRRAQKACNSLDPGEYGG